MPTELYQPRLVAFLDILGFKEAIKLLGNNTPAAQQEFQKILHILQYLKEWQNDYSSKIVSEDGLQVWRAVPAASVFSDHIAISYPLGKAPFDIDYQPEHKSFYIEGQLSHLNGYIGQIATHLLEIGYLMRGGVSIGRAYHQEDIIFGEAVVATADMDKSGQPPIIKCDNSLFNHLSTFAKNKDWVVFDEKSQSYYMNYLVDGICGLPDNFERNLKSRVTRIAEVIKQNIVNLKDSPELVKWQWISNYFEKALKHPRITMWYS